MTSTDVKAKAEAAAFAAATVSALHQKRRGTKPIKDRPDYEWQFIIKPMDHGEWSKLDARLQRLANAFASTSRLVAEGANLEAAESKLKEFLEHRRSEWEADLAEVLRDDWTVKSIETLTRMLTNFGEFMDSAEKMGWVKKVDG